MAININIQPSGIVPSGNNAWFRVGGSMFNVGGSTPADYKIIAKIYRVASGDTLVGTLTGIPSNSQTYGVSGTTYYWCEFNISQIVFNLLIADFSKLNNGITYASYSGRFKVVFEEYYGGSVSATVTSNTVSYTPFGLPEIRDYSVLESLYFNSSNHQKFLNRLAENSAVFYNQPIRMNYWSTFTDNSLYLYVRAYYRNGADSAVIQWPAYADSSPSVAGLVTWQITLSSIDWNYVLTLNPSITLTLPFDALGIYKVDFQVLYGPLIRKSEVKAYSVKHAELTKESKQFYFRNSFGTFEAIGFFGKLSKKDNFEFEQAELLVDNRNTTSSMVVKGGMTQVNKRHQQEIEIGSGFVSYDCFKSLVDLLLSNQVFEKVGDYYLPIIITDSSNEAESTDQQLFGRVITYKYAHLERFSI
ncbi:MAG: hypothetical protein L6Q78_10915 [Bacteroidia bacterium]|nr:hypothetical protein [Bacteroidia bacterium]